MAGAGFCGISLGALVPAEVLRVALEAAALPAWAMPALIMAPFMLLGQVGFSPTLTFITLSVVLPDPAVLGLPPVIFHVTILGVWGLASIGTPFSVPALVTARLFGDTPARVVYCWSPLYLVGAPLAVAALLGLIVATGAA
jgi:hypothetical protein